MNVSNIHRLNSFMQVRQDGRITMQGIALTNLIHRIIREYGKYDGVNYSVSLPEIEIIDKKLLLSHVCESEDYDIALRSSRYLEAVWEENESHIEKIIDAECGDVYREDMEEMGMISRRHSDNNECYWERR